MLLNLVKEEIPNADKQRKPEHQAQVYFVITLLQ
jgi:hypothetical protein